MNKIKSDIEIARKARLKPIKDILKRLRVPDVPEAFSPMGRHIAKINFEYLKKLKKKRDGKLILVTAISPTPAGEGKQLHRSVYQMELIKLVIKALYV